MTGRIHDQIGQIPDAAAAEVDEATRIRAAATVRRHLPDPDVRGEVLAMLGLTPGPPRSVARPCRAGGAGT